MINALEDNWFPQLDSAMPLFVQNYPFLIILPQYFMYFNLQYFNYLASYQ